MLGEKTDKTGTAFKIDLGQRKSLCFYHHMKVINEGKIKNSNIDGAAAVAWW